MSLQAMMDLHSRPTCVDRMGIHISAQLRISAMQLRDHRIEWAAKLMERAAEDIDALENMILKPSQETEVARDQEAEPDRDPDLQAW